MKITPYQQGRGARLIGYPRDMKLSFEMSTSDILSWLSGWDDVDKLEEEEAARNVIVYARGHKKKYILTQEPAVQYEDIEVIIKSIPIIDGVIIHPTNSDTI